MKIDLTKDNVKLIGRTKRVGDDLLLVQSGSGIEFEYTGEGFDLTFKAGAASEVPGNDANQVRMAVYVDGVRRTDIMLDAGKKTVHVLKGAAPGRMSADASMGVRRDPPGDISEDPLRGVRRDPYLAQWCKEDGGSHIIRVIKLSEAAMSIALLAPFEIAEEESVRPTPELPLKIEFIGDSITCGYGVDDEDPLHLFKTATEDVTRAYAYKTAAALNADYSMFSASGWGIISGWTDDPAIRHADQLIPEYYESLGLSYDPVEGVAPTGETAWDFDDYKPDVVVINLGTNDDSYTVEDESRQLQYAELYADFIEEVRKRNPNAYIFCVLGLMGDRLYPYVCRAVEIYGERCANAASAQGSMKEDKNSATAQDQRITTVHLPEQDGNIGYVCDYHPLESAHHKASEVMAEAVRTALNIH